MSTRTYELADIGDRAFAIFIDGLILSVIGGVVGAGGAGFSGGGIIGFIVGVAYHWYFLTNHNGQTPGKMLNNIQVIRVDGEEITDADAILRYIGYYVNSAVIGIGWLWALIDKRNRGWHDILAKTYVVKVDYDEADDVVVGTVTDKKKKNEDFV